MASSSVAYCNGQPKRIVAHRTVCQATCYPTHGGHGAASCRIRWQRRRSGATSTKQWLLILSIQKLATYALWSATPPMTTGQPTVCTGLSGRLAPSLSTVEQPQLDGRRMPCCLCVWCTLAWPCGVPRMFVAFPTSWCVLHGSTWFVRCVASAGVRCMVCAVCTAAHMAGLRQQLLDLRQRERPDEVGHVHDVAR
jgi:hypothetical protein